MKIIKFILLSMFVFTSCVSNKDMVYFQNTNTVQTTDAVHKEILKNYAPLIQVDDILRITVSASDIEASKPYNLFHGGNANGGGESLNYLVDVKGNINFPGLGEIKAEGITTNILKEKLVKSLEEFIIKPIVNVRLENFRITVLGEVSNPGVFRLENERITILEAIGLAGDLTIDGKRKNVMLVRKINGKVERITLDLTDQSIFISPYYYLAQNDVLYVEPNKTRINSSRLGTTSSILSIASAIISLGLILTR